MFQQKLTEYMGWLHHMISIYNYVYIHDVKLNGDNLFREERCNLQRPNNMMFMIIKNMLAQQKRYNERAIVDAISNALINNDHVQLCDVVRRHALPEDVMNIIIECVDLFLLSKKPNNDSSLICLYVYSCKLMQKCYLCLSLNNNNDIDIKLFNNKLVSLKPIGMKCNSFLFPSENMSYWAEIMMNFEEMVLLNNDTKENTKGNIMRNKLWDLISFLTAMIGRNNDKYEAYHNRISETYNSC